MSRTSTEQSGKNEKKNISYWASSTPWGHVLSLKTFCQIPFLTSSWLAENSPLDVEKTFLILSEQNVGSNSRKSSKSSVTSSSSSESSSPSIVPGEPPAPAPVVEEICHQNEG